MMDRLKALEERYEELSELMSQSEVLADLPLLQKYAREHSELTDVVTLYRDLKATDMGIADARSVLDDLAHGGGEHAEELGPAAVARGVQCLQGGGSRQCSGVRDEDAFGTAAHEAAI